MNITDTIEGTSGAKKQKFHGNSSSDISAPDISLNSRNKEDNTILPVGTVNGKKKKKRKRKCKKNKFKDYSKEVTDSVSNVNYVTVKPSENAGIKENFISLKDNEASHRLDTESETGLSKVNKKKNKKKKHVANSNAITDTNNAKIVQRSAHHSAIDTQQHENDSSKKKKKKKGLTDINVHVHTNKDNIGQSSGDSGKGMSKHENKKTKEKLESPFNRKKLSAMLSESVPSNSNHSKSHCTEGYGSAAQTDNSSSSSLLQKSRDRLNAARFRYLNEQLYTTTGKEAFQLFRKDQQAFSVYHEGFQSQVEKWPANPVDVIISTIKNRYVMFLTYFPTLYRLCTVIITKLKR